MQNLLPWRDGRCVQDQFPNSPYRADIRLLVISASYSRIAENNPDYDLCLKIRLNLHFCISLFITIVARV